MKKILIVDDDIVTRRLLTTTVESMGFISIQSSNGKRALDILYDNPDIKMVITDLMMPELNGRQFIQTLRGHAIFATLPIIIISGVVKMSEIVSLMELGASEFMGKPLMIEDVKECIHRLLDKKGDKPEK